MERPKKLSTGCESLDELLDGGIEHGIITNVYGGAGSGKTNFCIQAVVSALQNRDGKTVFVDTEGGFSSERFLQMHDDEEALERVLLQDPTSFEEQEQVFSELPELVEEEDIEMIVIDSLVSLYRLNLNGSDPQETNTELSKQFSVLSSIARGEDIPVLVTNQVYSRFDSEDDENFLVGRDIPAYWSKTLLELEKIGESRRKARIEKHRSRPEGIEAEFYITEESLASEEPDRDGMRVF
ncbi:MAG: DNA repair and recombination protein RadB [Candidatus Nanohaloarchaeota archaeon QJJ-7]|nr:DNA repair and recombination protein RadB [Candidatus Nanohaloarchaeota archaeon QJJ-7]